jgi:urea-proton symporter
MYHVPGTVFNDQAYWQRAIASEPGTSVKAFLWGGIAWFGIPMGIATSLGLAAVALAHGPNPAITLTSAEVSAGLPAVKGEIPRYTPAAFGGAN